MNGRILLLIATAFLTACAQGDFENSAGCPTLYPYSDEVQGRAAEELASLPAGSVLGDMISDYGVVRNEIRACRG